MKKRTVKATFVRFKGLHLPSAFFIPFLVLKGPLLYERNDGENRWSFWNYLILADVIKSL
jgi:hypothetical protein